MTSSTEKRSQALATIRVLYCTRTAAQRTVGAVPVRTGRYRIVRDSGE